MTANNLSLARPGMSLESDCADTESQSLDGEVATLYEPYELLWHQYHALETYSTDQSNPKDCRTHITVLLNFLRTCAIPNVQELIGLCNPQNIVQSISYPSLWFLFTPGTLVVEQKSTLSHSRVFSLVTVNPPSMKIDAKGRSVYGNLQIYCERLDYDGKALSFESKIIEIKPFDGVTLLSELDCIPLSLVEADEEKRDTLIARGKKFWDLRGQHLKDFVDGSYADRSLVVWSSLLYLVTFISFMAICESFWNEWHGNIAEYKGLGERKSNGGLGNVCTPRKKETGRSTWGERC